MSSQGLERSAQVQFTGQLQRCGFEEFPPHMHRQWTNDDRFDRLDSTIPLLPKNRDVLSVDDYYHINLDTISSDFDPDEEPRRTPRVYSPLPRSPKTPPESQLDSFGDEHSFRTKINPRGGRPIRRHSTLT